MATKDWKKDSFFNIWYNKKTSSDILINKSNIRYNVWLNSISDKFAEKKVKSFKTKKEAVVYVRKYMRKN